MTTHTAEDLANAEFARHPDGVVAARIYDSDTMPWITGDETWLSDAEMADQGWVPVREAAAHPITLDALRDAWENAEVADECNEGDVLIHRYSGSSRKVEVWVARRPGGMLAGTRILHRAPKPKRPEGAERLEAVLLKEWPFDGDDEAVDLADRLARRGVLVVEGGK